MTHLKKTQKELLAKLSITALNEMQEEVVLAIASVANTILLSPTGTGKTVAFFITNHTRVRPRL
jgi:Lhr-like helicase